MKSKHSKVKIGILGCGAIGSRMALGVQRDFSAYCRLTGIFDIDQHRTARLAKELALPKIIRTSIAELISNCDCMVEAVSASNTRTLIRQALNAKKSVLSMSVGKLLNASRLFRLASQNHCHLLIPSGAIAGLDAVKAAGLAGIHKITLTTRKPPSGFLHNAYLSRKGIDPLKIKNETVLYEGGVKDAVKYFPQNINVAATLALASQAPEKITLRILTSPAFKNNTHELEITGESGRIHSMTENVVCPDNPKTSYLAVLSGLQTLKQYCSGVYIGT